MLRRVFDITQAVSLSVLLATVALWVRSYWFEDRLIAGYGYAYIDIAAYKGELGCELTRYDPGGRGIYRQPWPVVRCGCQAVSDVFWRDEIHIADWQKHNPLVGYHDALGFRLHVRVSGLVPYGTARGIGVPTWFVLACASILPILSAMRRHRRNRRRNEGLCALCGYDLRASSDVCPECGTTAPHRGTA